MVTTLPVVAAVDPCFPGYPYCPFLVHPSKILRTKQSHFLSNFVGCIGNITELHQKYRKYSSIFLNPLYLLDITLTAAFNLPVVVCRGFLKWPGELVVGPWAVWRPHVGLHDLILAKHVLATTDRSRYFIDYN